MKTAAEWVNDYDVESFGGEGYYRTFLIDLFAKAQADAIESAAAVADADEADVKKQNRGIHPQFDCDLIRHSSGKRIAKAIRKLKP